MPDARRARKLGWTAIVTGALALPLFFVPTADGYGHATWALIGAIVLHPAAFAAIGALSTYRSLDPSTKHHARVALAALPFLLLIALIAGLTWSPP